MKNNSTGFNWSETKAGLRTLLTRNAMLIIVINVLNQCVVNFKNSWRSLAVMQDAGQSAVVLGVLMSFLTLVAMFNRPLFGGLMDKFRNHLKEILVVVMAVKAIGPLLFLISLNSTWLWFVFFVDSVTWSGALVIITAMMGVIIDRKALGSGFAIMTALTVVLSSYPRGWGVSVYNAMGLVNSAWITFGLNIALLIIVLFVSKKSLLAQYEKKEMPAKKAEEINNKKQKSSGKFLWSALPLAVMGAWPTFYQTLIASYMPVYATDMGFNYTGAVAIGGTIAGVITLFVGVLTDIVNPYWIVLITYAANFLSPLVMGGSATNQMFMLGIILFYSAVRSANMPLQVLNFRKHGVAQQGAVSATHFFCMDVVSIIAGTICGYLVQESGYQGTFKFFTMINGLAVVIIAIIMVVDYKNKQKASQISESKI